MKPAKQDKLMFRVPANKEGRNILHNIKKSLNADSYSLRTMYTGPRPKGTPQASTREENATSIRVYVESKREEDNISPYDYIARGREIERDQLAQVLYKHGLQVDYLIQQNKVLETKLALLNEGLKNSTKYRYFIDVVNSITDAKGSSLVDK